VGRCVQLGHTATGPKGRKLLSRLEWPGPWQWRFWGVRLLNGEADSAKAPLDRGPARQKKGEVWCWVGLGHVGRQQEVWLKWKDA
jgi:hypothetical protein